MRYGRYIEPLYPTDEVRPRLRRAFAALRRDGFIALMNHLCCQTCACYDISERVKKAGGDPDKALYAFYHNQDNDDLVAGQQLHIAYGPDAAAGERIRAALEAEGLAVEWNGEHSQRIAMVGLTPPEPDATFLDLVGAEA